MKRYLSTEGLARASASRPWITIGIWGIGLIVSVALIAVMLGDALTTNDHFTGDPESEQAWRILFERGFKLPQGPSEIVIVTSDALFVDDPEFQLFVEDLFDDLVALGGDRTRELSTNYYRSGDPSLVSDDRHTTILPIMSLGLDSARSAVAAARATERYHVLITGPLAIDRDFEDISKSDLSVELKIGIPAAIVVLILVFGTLSATAVPIVLALVSIILAMGATAVIGQAFTFSFFVTNMIAMMGLAVGVDYSLFIVSRFREERSRGKAKIDAIATTGATASRAVFFSGVTVLLALLGMLMVPQTIFRSLGGGAILVVLMAVVASLTLLPAILSVMGDRVNSLKVPLIGERGSAAGDYERGFWHAVAGAVMRRPLISLVVMASIMIAAAVPYGDINTGFPSISTFPDKYESKKGFLILARDFTFSTVSPAFVVIDGDVASEAVSGAAEALRVRILADAVFEDVALELDPEARLGVITARLAGDPAADQAVEAIRRLRGSYAPDAFSGVDARVLVTGETAENVDFFDIADGYLPYVVAFVLGLSFILLTVVFRSLVVPVKAIIMNLLSVGAAYGLMVLVFQKGVGADLLGFRQVDMIAAWIPLFLFSVLFGLSMDYHVFLLSRIRERFLQTGDNAEAVAYGLASTGGLITGAALIMVAVFWGFAMGQLVMFQQVGFGLAVAVFLDATVVRSILVPASMKLLGTRNWWLPSALDWLPRLQVEGAEPTDIAADAD